MNRELLESISDLTYAQARFFGRPAPFHLQRQFLAVQERMINLLTQFPARLPPPPAAEPIPIRQVVQQQFDIPINIIDMLFPNAANVLGAGAGAGAGVGNSFWNAVTVSLTAEQLAAATRDYTPDPELAAHELCCICQEGISTEPAVETNCPGQTLPDGSIVTNHHSLHRRCANTWFSLSTKCPVCRADLRTLTSTTTNAGAGAPGGDSFSSSVYTDL